MKRLLTILYWTLLSYLPLPREWHRRWLHRDWQNRIQKNLTRYLESSFEAHRYSLIAGWVEYRSGTHLSVLDVGCGSGILATRMSFDSYRGIDVSEAELRQALQRGIPNASFTLCPAEEFHSDDTYGAIIFNESLYYMENPSGVVQRLTKMLSAGGVVVICMFRTAIERRIWKELDRLSLQEVAMVEITNEHGSRSILRCYEQVKVT